MSLKNINDVFQSLETCENWSVQLLNIKISKKDGAKYSSREIVLSPDEFLKDFINEIANIYTGNGKKSLERINSVREYDGTADSFSIYKLKTDDKLICEEYNRLMESVADPDFENDPFEYTSAQLLKGQIMMNEEPVPIKLITMQNPITSLKHKFLNNNGTFEELSQKVLSLKPTVDIIIVEDMVYFMTLSGENLFNMARSYKKVCEQKISEIQKADFLTGYEEFNSIASSGHNPRRFISFNEINLNALKKRSTRLEIAKQFSIPLDKTSEKFDATKSGAAEKVIKLLCNKGMINPFDKTAVEVDGARNWV